MDPEVAGSKPVIHPIAYSDPCRYPLRIDPIAAAIPSAFNVSSFVSRPSTLLRTVSLSNGKASFRGKNESMAYGLWHETNGDIKAGKRSAPITCHTPLAIRASLSAFQFPNSLLPA